MKMTKMKFSNDKITNNAIALILILTIVSPIMAFLPLADSATVSYQASYCYNSVSPNTVGIGQNALIVFWLNVVPPDIGEIAGTAPGARAGWDSLTITLTDPVGKNSTTLMSRSDSIGGGYFSFTPNQVGNYTIQTSFPGEWKNTTTTQLYTGSSISVPITLVVQQDPITQWQETPLPNDYFTRPINTLNRDWYQVASNWLGGAAQTQGSTASNFGFGKAPESAHILWTRPNYVGGIMDYRTGDTGYQTTHYQGLNFRNPIVLNAKLYYAARSTAHVEQGYYCVDLYTGQTLYLENNTDGHSAMPSFGQIYNYESPNQHGGFSYLWRTSGVTLPAGYTTSSGLQTWQMIDGYTGNPVTTVANVSAGGTAVYGEDGSILRYSLSTTGGVQRLLLWNSSAIPTMLATSGDLSTTSWQWRPQGGGSGGGPPIGYYIQDGSKGFSLNVTITPTIGQPTIYAVREGEFIIGGSVGSNNEQGITQGVMWKMSLVKGEEGKLLSNSTFTPPSTAGNQTIYLRAGYVDPEDGIFQLDNSQTLQRYVYSLDTMKQLWVSQPEPALNYYNLNSAATNSMIYQGALLSWGIGGVVIGYDVKTGEVLWNYTAKGIGNESPYGNYPLGLGIIADGKIYIGANEHSPSQPLWRGEVFQCLNVSNGALLWNFPLLDAYVPGLQGDVAILADGRLIAMNSYDNEIYCFGRGPSATTVSAPQINPQLGSSVTITGTVTDQTQSGRLNENFGLDFSLKGTPAISDADQSAWIQHLFQQQPLPKNAKGVEVSLDTVDPNGNLVHIGTVTSDITGAYGCNWKPQVPGTYQIIATFKESASYGGSFAQTYMTISEAASTSTPAVTPLQQSMADMYFVPAIAGLSILVIAVLVLVLLLTLRKRP